MILVICESPGKIKKINDYLGSDYIVKASFGHVQDLDKSTLSIDVENNFKPYYIVNPDKKKVVKELTDISKKCKDIILASDGDREGEAIAYSLASVLNIKDPKRIIFHEITKKAITDAIQNPTVINLNMVYAQQARRLLDRLVGYKISPVLWKYLKFDGTVKSAGRVQSVVVKIIIDKENEISKSLSESYYKITAEFNNLSAVLENGHKHITNEDEAKSFIKLINDLTIFKVISVDNKTSIRKPSPPFITSSLQQEASTKLHFSVSKTMQVAQKLYEAGLITYMRSDCPNISKDAITNAEKYIIKTYGKEYSDPKNYASKNANSQDAHECIRPTYLEKSEIDGIDDQKKLYSLIWKRTIASQMSPAQVNVQTIVIDAINDKKSILIFNKKQLYFNSILENVEFPGYMIVYDNTLDDNDVVKGKLNVKVSDKLTFNKLKITEEYTKLPLRYNEAGLVKYLEKNGIGRPSTYASIISKILDRKYVEIKNIDGIKKKSKCIELDNTYKITEKTKDTIIGKEMKKMVPTTLGETVNTFMVQHFESIMEIEFTSKFETYLDKIAEGKANWITILQTFYDLFHPIVEKLMLDSKKMILSSDKLLGTHNDIDIFIGTGKFGLYIKYKDDSDKWKYTAIENENITLDEVKPLLEYPKDLGKIGKALVTLNIGKFGLYIKYKNKNYPVKNTDDDKIIDIQYAKEIIENNTDIYAIKSLSAGSSTYNIKNGEFGNYIQKISTDQTKQNYSIPQEYNIETITITDILNIISNSNTNNKSFKIKDKIINVNNGKFGPYIQIISGTKKQNISISNKYNIETMTEEDVLKIIADKNGTTTNKAGYSKGFNSTSSTYKKK
jgi:DNA topoisomerase-1